MAAKKKQQEQDSVSRFKIDGKVYEIDMQSFTWGETEELELFFGEAAELVDFNSARAAMFLAYLARKRKQPGFTLDDMRALRVDSVEAVDAPDPTTPANAKPASAGSPAS